MSKGGRGLDPLKKQRSTMKVMWASDPAVAVVVDDDVVPDFDTCTRYKKVLHSSDPGSSARRQSRLLKRVLSSQGRCRQHFVTPPGNQDGRKRVRQKAQRYCVPLFCQT